MRISGAISWSLVSIWLVLLGCSGNSIDDLVVQLTDKNPEVRRTAAQVLAARSGNSPALVAALGLASTSSDVEVREIAVEGLGQPGRDAATVLPLLEKSLADPELSVRLKSALAIHRIAPQNQSYVPVLDDSLRAGHGTVFLEVGRMGEDARWAVPTLLKLLSDQRANVRALAAQTLGQIGVADQGAIEALKLRLRDNRPAVRNAAERSLKQLAGKS
jgi:HEAT repeat protein